MNHTQTRQTLGPNVERIFCVQSPGFWGYRLSNGQHQPNLRKSFKKWTVGNLESTLCLVPWGSCTSTPATSPPTSGDRFSNNSERSYEVFKSDSHLLALANGHDQQQNNELVAMGHVQAPPLGQNREDLYL
jgi:hypothetical protein